MADFDRVLAPWDSFVGQDGSGVSGDDTASGVAAEGLSVTRFARSRVASAIVPLSGTHSGLGTSPAIIHHITAESGPLVTLPSRPAATQTTSTTIVFASDTTTDASTVVYMPYHHDIFNPGVFGVLSGVTLINKGVAWGEGSDSGATGISASGATLVDNRGLVVGTSNVGGAFGIDLVDSNGFSNTGQIYATATGDRLNIDAGLATGVNIYHPTQSIENAGLIAASSAALRAVGLGVSFDPTHNHPVLNSGTILAEGVFAIGIDTDGYNPIQIENTGRIETQTTSSVLSVGIAGTINAPMTVVNSGTITADAAIYVEFGPQRGRLRRV